MWTFRIVRAIDTQTLFNFLLVIFTAVLSWVAVRQYNLEQMTERARIAIGREDGVLADFYQFGDTCGVYVFFRNIGHTTAERFTANGWWWDEYIGAVNFPAVNSDYVKQQGYGPDLPAQSPFTLDTIVPCDQITLAEKGKSHMIIFGRYRFQPEGSKKTICESFAVERMPNTGTLPSTLSQRHAHVH